MARSLILALALSLFAQAPTLAEPPAGLLHKTSPKSVSEAVDAFQDTLNEKGIEVFAVIDHASGAASVDLELEPLTLVIFGNPKVGTPMMQQAPTMGFDLPMKALFSANDEGGTDLYYSDIATLAARHGLERDHDAVKKAAQALENLTDSVVD